MSKEKFEAAKRGKEAIYVDRVASRWLSIFGTKADEVAIIAHKAAGENNLEKVIEYGAEMAVLAKLVETCAEMRDNAIEQELAQAAAIVEME